MFVAAPIRTSLPTGLVGVAAPPMVTDPAPPAPVPPLFDFPDIAAGDAFDLAKGSKVGFVSVKGEATVNRFEPAAAEFRLIASALGQRVDVKLVVSRLDGDRVQLVMSRAGKPDQTEIGRVVESRQNYVEIENAADPSKRTVIQAESPTRVIIDADVPGYGNAHLVLAKRDAAPALVG